MKTKVYIETSIPSFYFEIRKEPEMVAQKNWTRKWWDSQRSNYDIAISEAVLDELKRGNYPNQQNLLNMVKDIPILLVEEGIDVIVETYIKHHLMPKDPLGDALHLALASFHKCDFLLTWNCNHLANANKFSHIKQINVMLGLFVPTLVTPLELMKELGENI